MKITRLGPTRPLISLTGLLSGGDAGPAGQVPTSIGSNGAIAWGSNVALITVNGTTKVLGPYVNFANGSNTTVTVDQVGSVASNTIRVHSTGGGGSLTVQDEGSPLATDATTLNFVGAGVTATGGGATKTITIPGGGSSTDDPIADIFGAPDTAFEFDSSSLAGLTAIGTPDVEDADTTVPDCLYYKDDTSSTAWMGRYMASPATPFTAITKVMDYNFRQDFMGGGLIVGVTNPATGAFVTCIVAHNSTRIFNAEKFTNRTTFSSTLGGGVLQYPHAPVYLGVIVNSTTSIDYLWSLNGRIWRRFVTANNPSLTVASVGIAMKSENSNGAAIAFDFFRVWNSAKTFPGV